VATIRIILHGKAAADPRLRAAVETMRTDGHSVGGFGSRVTVLREGAQSIRAKLVTKRSSGIEYESEHDPNINLDGEPIVAKQFRVECCQRALPVRLGESPFSQRPTCPDAIPKAAALFS